MNHPIWCSLALKIPVEFKRLEALFTVLEPKVKKLIYHPITESLPVQKRRKASFELLWRLLKVGNMDALTALVLYWHEASNDSDSSLPTLSQREIAKFIYKLLVSFGSVMYLRGLDRLMFKVVSEYIFKQTDWQNQYVGIGSTHANNFLFYENLGFIFIPNLIEKIVYVDENGKENRRSSEN